MNEVASQPEVGGAVTEAPQPVAESAVAEGPVVESPVVESSAITRKPASRKRWFVAGAVALVAAVVVGYLLAGAAVANSSIRASDKALQSTFSHQDQVINTLEENPLKTINLNSDNPDLTAAKSALDAFGPKVKSAQALVNVDLAALRSANESAQSGSQSPFTLAQRPALDQKVKRTGAAILALLSAQRGLNADDQAVTFLQSLIVSWSDFEALSTALNKDDVAGASAIVPRLQQELATTVSSGQQANLPPQLNQLTTGVQALVGDIKSLIDAVQANDPAAANRSLAQMDADVKTVSGFDEAGANQWIDQLTSSLRETYNAQMKVAQGR